MIYYTIIPYYTILYYTEKKCTAGRAGEVPAAGRLQLPVQDDI